MSLMKAVLAQSSITIKEPQAGVKDIGKLLSSGIQVAMIIAAILTFAFLVWGGIQWILSGGDKTQTQAARDRITMALVGLGIVAAAWALMKVIGYFFGIDVFQFSIPTAGGQPWPVVFLPAGPLPLYKILSVLLSGSSTSLFRLPAWPGLLS